MPNFAAWSSENQATALAEIIGYKSVSTGTITRGSGTVTARTVRLETLSGQREIAGPNGQTYTIAAMLLDVYGAGWKVGDRFAVNGQAFEAVAIMPGHIDCEQVYLILRR